MNNTAGQIARTLAPRRTAMAMPDHLEKLATRLPTKLLKTRPQVPIVDRELVTKPREKTAAELKHEEAQQRIREELDAIKRRQEQIRARLKDMKDYRRHPSRAKRLLNLIAKIHGITVDDILDVSRKKHIVPVRQLSMWIIHRNCTDASGVQIGWCAMGRLFERDHATVMHSVRKVYNQKRLFNRGMELELELLMMEREIYADNTSSALVEDGGEYAGNCEGAQDT